MWFTIIISFLLVSAKKSPQQGKFCFLDNTCIPKPLHLLGPRDVVEPIGVFADWKFTDNRTVDLGGKEITLAEGVVEHVAVGVTSSFSILAGVVTRHEVASILRLLNKYGTEQPFDSDPDTVDGMSSHEVFIESPDLPHEPNSATEPWMKLDGNPQVFASRKKLRAKLKKIMHPIVTDRITPFVQQHLGRECTPCYSLVRKYKSGERLSHGVHYDGHAFATVVISLKDFGTNYRGGLYVSTSYNRQNSRIVGLLSGDAVIHQSDLLHGVEVDNDGGERWSWILWFRDTPSCSGSSEYKWFEACAHEGNAVCQFLQATKSNKPDEVVLWNQKAAEQGFGPSMVKLARAHLKTLPSNLPYDEGKAIDLFKNAVNTTGEPDAYYGLATLALKNNGLDGVITAFQCLLAAARGGHAFSMFNLGIAHLYGYGVPARDPNLAAEWFLESYLPEGLAAVAMHRQSIGDQTEASRFQDIARRLGYGAPWRKFSREKTGSGGAGGVDMNLPWPTLAGGLRPEIF